MKSVRWMISYILVASLGLWLAFAVSMRFIAPAHSQNAPSSGELPPEFMKEVEATQVPPSSGTPAKDAGKDAAKDAAKTAEKVVIPPPPSEAAVSPEVPVGDGATATPAAGTEFVPRDGYTYDPTGKRDPFKPFRSVRSLVTNQGKVTETMEPLQRWDVDRLQVVGILWDVRKPRAMVRDPDGVVHTVLKNSKIGRSEGIVAAIREGEVVIIETKYDDGNAIRESRVLELKK